MLNKRLIELISILGIKKSEFSQKIGFSQAYVSMILAGKRTTPSDRFYESICREFQVNNEWLRTGEGDMFVLPQGDFSETDLELLKKYKSLPLSEQKIVDEIIYALILKNLKAGELIED